jgi:hypothetical protein
MKRLLALMVALLLASLTAQHALSVGTPDEKQPVQLPVKQPIPPKATPAPLYPEMLDPGWIETRGVPRECGGIISAVGKDSLTLTFLPTVEEVWRPDPNGKMIFVKVNPVPAAPPKTFKLSSLLADGKAFTQRGPEWSYGIADVKVGDRVQLYSHKRPDGTDCCDNIRVTGRPGGKIPPAPGEPEDKQPYRYHERAQAYQDFAEKGTPIPDKFLPESERKTAPMPREVKVPRIPHAEP